MVITVYQQRQKQFNRRAGFEKRGKRYIIVKILYRFTAKTQRAQSGFWGKRNLRNSWQKSFFAFSCHALLRELCVFAVS
jgi:hypothetical protein